MSDNFEKKIKEWNEMIKDAPLLYDYMKDNIHEV